MQLVHKATGEPVQVGEVVTDFRGDRSRVVSMQEPRHAGSTGRVYVCDIDDEPTAENAFGYYPSVFGLEWNLTEEEQEAAARDAYVRAPGDNF